jgi:hypothetical protein
MAGQSHWLYFAFFAVSAAISGTFWEADPEGSDRESKLYLCWLSISPRYRLLSIHFSLRRVVADKLFGSPIPLITKPTVVCRLES